MRDRWLRGGAQNLVRLIIKWDGIAISPDAPQLERLNLTAPKSKEIELYLMPGKIDHDRTGPADAFPSHARHANVGPVNEDEAVPRRRFPKEMKSFAGAQHWIAGANIFPAGRM